MIRRRDEVLEGFRTDTGQSQECAVKRAVKMIFAIGGGENCAAFVEYASRGDVANQNQNHRHSLRGKLLCFFAANCAVLQCPGQIRDARCLNRFFEVPLLLTSKSIGDFGERIASSNSRKFQWVTRMMSFRRFNSMALDWSASSGRAVIPGQWEKLSNWQGIRTRARGDSRCGTICHSELDKMYRKIIVRVTIWTGDVKAEYVTCPKMGFFPFSG